MDSVPRGHVPSMDELAGSLPYLNAVFKETLRLYPIAVFTVRNLQEDCNILGYPVPKGTQLHVRSLNSPYSPIFSDSPAVFLHYAFQGFRPLR